MTNPARVDAKERTARAVAGAAARSTSGMVCGLGAFDCTAAHCSGVGVLVVGDVCGEARSSGFSSQLQRWFSEYQNAGLPDMQQIIMPGLHPLSEDGRLTNDRLA